jgi:hypothetical protein
VLTKIALLEPERLSRVVDGELKLHDVLGERRFSAGNGRRSLRRMRARFE